MKFRYSILIILILFLTGCNDNTYLNGEVNVLNWSSYIPQEVIDEFSKEYNIKVNYGTYSSNEELLAKLSSSSKGTYDLIFPSDYMIDLMIQREMLEKIDITKISNYKNISELFLSQEYDIFNEYSLPFLATTTVIAVNRDNIKEDISCYNDLLNVNYKNNIVLLDDQRIVIGMALQANGFLMNSTNKDELNLGKEWLLKLKKNIKAFDSDSPKNFLITGEADIGVVWSAEAVLAKKENPNIEIVYPKNGHAISIDNYAIPTNAKNIENAYKFIDYLLRYDINEKITDTYPYISTNNIYKMYSYEEIINILETGYYVQNIGEYISLYDETWAEIK